MSLEPTIASPPTTQDAAAQMLAAMAALSGQVTDYNSGSQIRTMALAMASIIEQQGVWTQAAAFQAAVYGAMLAFGITPLPATYSIGNVLFATALTSAPQVSQSVAIPSGTIVQTIGGVQFATITTSTLLSGTTGIGVPVQAVLAGTTGNVPASGITQLVTGLLYPIQVTNPSPMTGGTAAEALSQTLARFASAVSETGLASPGAIANAAIGVQYAPTGETVLYSTCYEPFLYAGSGVGSGTAGWTLYIDNGLGGASTGLINAVINKLNGVGSGGVGYRDAGVPYAVSGVTPTYAVVGVTGTCASITTSSVVSGIINSAVSGYFTLAFGASAQQAPLAQQVGNAVLGLVTTLAVSLYASGSPTAVSSLGTSPSGRVTLYQINLSLQ